jgi:hypothetical protein
VADDVRRVTPLTKADPALFSSKTGPTLTRSLTMKPDFIPLGKLSISKANMRHDRKAPDVVDLLPYVRKCGVLTPQIDCANFYDVTGPNVEIEIVRSGLARSLWAFSKIDPSSLGCWCFDPLAPSLVAASKTSPDP